MDRGAWWTTVHGVTQSQIRLKWLSTHAHTVTGTAQSSSNTPPAPTLEAWGLLAGQLPAPPQPADSRILGAQGGARFTLLTKTPCLHDGQDPFLALLRGTGGLA